MIKLNEKQEIILKHTREGLSQRQISRQTGIDRKTIRKYLNEYETLRHRILQAEGDENRIDRIDLISDLVDKPKYNAAGRQKRALTEDVVRTIEYYLDQNALKKKHGQLKQCMKMLDIHQALLTQGHDIGYTTVRNFINTVTNSGKEAFIRIHYEPADVLEFDWGEVKVYIAGSLTTLQMAVFTSAYSNYRFAVVFRQQKTQCFTEAHVKFFAHTNGVYSTLVYDNMKVAVKTFVGINEKQPTESLLNMSLYYGFKFRFCNVRRGNEKGHVERSVEYVRRKAFCLQDEFLDLQEVNAHLLRTCTKLNSEETKSLDGHSAQTLFLQEKPLLKEAMVPYETAKVTSLRVDKYSTVTVDNCHYSVDESCVGQMVLTKIYTDRLRCFYQGRVVGEHMKKYGAKQWSLEIAHYLKTLTRKPGAVGTSEALRQTDVRIRKIYTAFYIGKEKAFVELLELLKTYKLDEIEATIEKVRRVTPADVSTEKIHLLLNRKEIAPPEGGCDEITRQAKEHLLLYSRMVKQYGQEFVREAQIL